MNRTLVLIFSQKLGEQSVWPVCGLLAGTDVNRVFGQTAPQVTLLFSTFHVSCFFLFSFSESLDFFVQSETIGSHF